MSTTDTEETPVAFYRRQIAEKTVHAAKLLEMYRNRKIKDTPLTDAIWEGHRALVNEIEDFREMLVKLGAA